MYLPDHFRQSDRAAALELVSRYPFATLVSHTVPPDTSHVPITAADLGDGIELEGHLARANPLADAVLAGERFTAIFLGPHAYVSPTWYATPGLVPTWNFAAVHFTGNAEPVTGRRQLAELVESLADRFERHCDDPWIPDYPDAMLEAIVGFRIRVEVMDAKYKLSQNRGPRDRAGVIASLKSGGRDETDLADYMERFAPV